MPIFYVLLSFVTAKLVQNSGLYPSGVDTLAHLYRGDYLYQSIRNGNFWPFYDTLWYNGMEALRFQAPLASYVLALCQLVGGGSVMNGLSLIHI